MESVRVHRPQATIFRRNGHWAHVFFGVMKLAPTQVVLFTCFSFFGSSLKSQNSFGELFVRAFSKRVFIEETARNFKVFEACSWNDFACVRFLTWTSLAISVNSKQKRRRQVFIFLITNPILAPSLVQEIKILVQCEAPPEYRLATDTANRRCAAEEIRKLTHSHTHESRLSFDLLQNGRVFFFLMRVAKVALFQLSPALRSVLSFSSCLCTFCEYFLVVKCCSWTRILRRVSSAAYRQSPSPARVDWYSPGVMTLLFACGIP